MSWKNLLAIACLGITLVCLGGYWRDVQIHKLAFQNGYEQTRPIYEYPASRVWQKIK